MTWYGNIIHNNPHIYNVELKSNCTRRGSKATFRKLFPEKKIPHADVSAVWELVRYRTLAMVRTPPKSTIF